MTERLADPQALKPSASDSPKLSIASEKSEDSASAVERPKPSDVMYQRQASFRGLGQLSGNTPFKRGGKGSTSLRLNDLPSTRDRKGGSLCDSPILEDIELPPSNLEDVVSVMTKSSHSSQKNIDLLTCDEPEVVGVSGTSTPAMLGVDSVSQYSMSPPPSLLQPLKLHNVPETPESSLNPWDNVPDQPQVTASSAADSWLNSLTSSLASTNTKDIFNSNSSVQMTSMASVTSKLSVDVTPEASSKSNGTSSGYNSPSSTNSTHSASNDIWQNDVSKSILEDPFDAEWAAIATRNSEPSNNFDESTKNTPTNPFLESQDKNTSVKAFELQL